MAVSAHLRTSRLLPNKDQVLGKKCFSFVQRPPSSFSGGYDVGIVPSRESGFIGSEIHEIFKDIFVLRVFQRMGAPLSTSGKVVNILYDFLTH